MEAISLIILTFSIIIGVKLAKKHGAPISHCINFTSWIYGVEFLLTAAILPYTFFLIDTNNHWVFKHINNLESIKTKVNFIISYCALAIPLGFYLANILLKKFHKESNYQKFITKEFTYKESFLFEMFILLISIFYFIYTVYKIGFIPHFKLLDSSHLEIAQIRGNLTHHFPASNHLKELIGLTLIPISSIYFFSKLYVHKNLYNFLMLITFTFLSMFYTTINLNKSGIIIYLIGFFIAYTILIKGKLKFSKFISFSLTSFIFLIISYKIIRPDYDMKNTLTKITNRIFHAQAFGNYLAIDFFPKEHDHLGLHSVSKISEKIGFEYSPPSSRIMMKKVLPKNVKQGTAGYLTSHFFAEAWANFGIIGILLSPIYIGLFIKLIIGILISFDKSPLVVALISYISLNMNIADSFNHIFIPRYLALSIAILFLLNKLSKKLTNQELF